MENFFPFFWGGQFAVSDYLFFAPFFLHDFSNFFSLEAAFKNPDQRNP